MLLAGAFSFASSAFADPPGAPIRSALAVANPDDPVVLPEFKVNDLRQRLEKRDAIRQARGYSSLCLNRGDVIESICFCAEYVKSHPEEKARVILAVRKRPDPNAVRPVHGLVVYTREGRLWFHDYFLGDGTFPFLIATDISTLSDMDLIHRHSQTAVENAFGADATLRRDGSIIGAAGTSLPGLARIPNGLPGDNDNLQVLFAEEKLREAGIQAEVKPAKEQFSKDDNLLLIFAVNNVRYVYRPAYGCFQLQDQNTAATPVPVAPKTPSLKEDEGAAYQN